MKTMMYSAAAIALLALGACDDSSTPSVTPPPTPEPPAAGPVTQDGTTTTYRDDSNENLERLVSNSGYRITDVDPAVVDAAQVILDDAVEDKADAEAELARLAGLPDLDTDALRDEAINILNALRGIAPGTFGPVADPATGDNLGDLVAEVQAGIDSDLADAVADAEDNLRFAQVNAAETSIGAAGSNVNMPAQWGETVTLPDGTVLRTASMGNVQADADGPFVSSRVVAAYEEDNLGNVVRVAFVETSGIDYVPTGATGWYSAGGFSGFGVRVDGSFFDELYGSSSVDINLDSESGIVTASADSVRRFANVTYDADISFDPATGAFTSSNGEVVYTAFGAYWGDADREVVSVNNAQLLGQLHGAVDGQFGADYTGMITVTPGDTGRLEVIGAINGNGSTP